MAHFTKPLMALRLLVFLGISPDINSMGNWKSDRPCCLRALVIERGNLGHALHAPAAASVTLAQIRFHKRAGSILHGLRKELCSAPHKISSELADRIWASFDQHPVTPSLPLPPRHTGQFTEAPLPTLYFQSEFTLER